MNKLYGFHSWEGTANYLVWPAVWQARHCIQKLKPVPALGWKKHSSTKTKLFVPQRTQMPPKFKMIRQHGWFQWANGDTDHIHLASKMLQTSIGLITVSISSSHISLELIKKLLTYNQSAMQILLYPADHNINHEDNTNTLQMITSYFPCISATLHYLVAILLSLLTC